jgi:hypothetical protein
VKEICIPFIVTLTLQQTDVHWVEAQLLEQRTRVFLTALHQVLAHVEAEAIAGARCPECTSGLVRNGRVGLVLETLLGRVEYDRQRLRCPRCGLDVYPLDEALGLLPGSGSTLGVRERALWAATEVSYAKTAAFLAKFAGLAISHGSVHRWAQEEGAVREQEEAAAQEQVFGRHPTGLEGLPRGPSRLYVQMDGTMVHERGGGAMECKVGIVYSQRAEISRGRIALLDKRSYASFDDAETFGERFWVRCAAQGAVQAEQIVFISDGADWIHTLQRAYFPAALVVLDPWHLARYLQQVWGVEARGLIGRCLQDAWRGDVRRLLHRVRARVAHEGDPARRTEGQQLIDYLQANAEGIANLARLEATGSGATEKTVDVLVSHRYKKRGMSWGRSGSGALMRLRLLKANGEWDAYWQRRRAAFARTAT